MVGFVQVIYLQSSAKDVGIFTEFLFSKLIFLVVLVFDLAEDLFNYILHAHQSGRASKFVYDDSEAFMLIYETYHQLISESCLCYDYDWRENIFYFLGSFEQRR